jgi:hypothetical protein
LQFLDFFGQFNHLEVPPNIYLKSAALRTKKGWETLYKKYGFLIYEMILLNKSSGEIYVSENNENFKQQQHMRSEPAIQSDKIVIFSFILNATKFISAKSF